MLHVAGWFSGIHTQMEFSAGMCTGMPLGSTLWNQEGRNRVRQREGSSWITGQTTWADHMGVWSDDGSPGLSWHIQWPVLYTSTQMDHCMQAAPRGAGGLRLLTGSTYSCWTMSPWREVRTALSVSPSVCIKAPEVGGEGALWGNLLMTDV